MHLPDGILPWWQSLIYLSISLPFLAHGFKKLREQMGDRSVSMISLLAAGIFVVQTIHFPIPGGTCAHVVGAALVAYFLGFWGVVVVMGIVLLIQSIFGEGGITAYGANLLSMGIIAGFSAAFVLTQGKKKIEKRTEESLIIEEEVHGSIPSSMMTYLAVASFVSTLLTGVVAGLEVAISGAIPFETVMPVMFGWHIVLGAIDVVMTLAIIRYIAQNAPDIVSTAEFSVAA